MIHNARIYATIDTCKKHPPKKPPRLNQVVRLIAMLGGSLERKGDGEPGVKTLWQWQQRVTDFATGLRYARRPKRFELCIIEPLIAHT
jgi:hypothetical protein